MNKTVFLTLTIFALVLNMVAVILGLHRTFVLNNPCFEAIGVNFFFFVYSAVVLKWLLDDDK